MKIFNKNRQNKRARIFKSGFIIAIACMVIIPTFSVYAECVNGKDTQTGQPCQVKAGADNTDGVKAGADNTDPENVNVNGVKINTGIKNPLGNGIKDIPDFIVTVLNIVLIIGIPIVALAIIYSGFLFVTAAGNSEKLKKAKATLLYTIIGAALLLGSLVIAEAIKGTVDEIKKTTYFYEKENHYS
ncbi:MAG: pilin [Patescibacteria group bacterium]